LLFCFFGFYCFRCCQLIGEIKMNIRILSVNVTLIKYAFVDTKLVALFVEFIVVFTARCYAERGSATVCRLSVWTLRYDFIFIFIRRNRQQKRKKTNKHIHTKYKNSNEEHRNSDIKELQGWNTSKIFSRPNSLRHMLTLTPAWTIWCNGNTPTIRVE